MTAPRKEAPGDVGSNLAGPTGQPGLDRQPNPDTDPDDQPVKAPGLYDEWNNRIDEPPAHRAKPAPDQEPLSHSSTQKRSRFEFERELIKARTREVRMRAPARRKSLGRPFKLTLHRRRDVLDGRSSGEGVREIARSYDVNASSMSRTSKRRYHCDKLFIATYPVRRMDGRERRPHYRVQLSASADRPYKVRMWPRPANVSVSYRTVIAWLLAVFVIPGALFGYYLFTRYAASERARFAQEAQEVAHAAASVLETNIRGWITTLQTFATSERLQHDDFEGFHRRAIQIKEFLGAEIVLRDLGGRQLVNTRRPFGADLPITPTAVDQKVAELGLPQITDVFRGTIVATPQISIVVPVRKDGRVTYLLQMTAETLLIHQLIKPVVPSNWFVAVGDRQGIYVTRSEEHEVFSGRPGNTEFLAQAIGPSGSFLGRSIRGEGVLVGYVRSTITGWLIAANIRQSVVEEPLTAAFWQLGILAVSIFIAAVVAGLCLWRLLDRPLQALTRASASVAEGNPFPDIQTNLKELSDLRDSLASASERIREHTTTLERRVLERTEQLEATNQRLAQAQKMEAIGNLTGGVAHDFNNLLQVINGNLELMAPHLAGQPELQRRVDNALIGVDRGAKLAKQLLAFGRRQPLDPKPVSVGRLLTGMDDMLRRSLGETIEVEIVVAAGLWSAFVDAANLENSVLNLSINARDAMAGGGKLTIEAANAFLDAEYCAAHSDVQPGQYVMLAVTDTGSGMPPEIQAKVFEPFFTTKPVGKGSGLGLSMVYGFVKQSAGHVKIYSEPGHGTTVRLYLPRSLAEAEQTAGVFAPLAAGGTERVLVVEDDEAVRDTTMNALRELGYRVTGAANADAAAKLIEEGLVVDVVFTDVVMPGQLKSTDLARIAKERLPQVAILFASGYSENSIVHGGRLDPGVHLLSKPYRRDALARKIREVLSRSLQNASEAAQSKGNALRILVCEDEALIRVNIVEMLEDLGHSVVEAQDGTSAIGCAEAETFDLLITDLGLPDMSGHEVAAHIQTITPGIATIFATGDVVPAAGESVRTMTLVKPFDQKSLQAAIAQVQT